MPWTMASAPKHTKKASTPAAKQQWATVANKTLATTGSDATAIKIANAAVAHRTAKDHPRGRRKAAPK